MKRSTRPIISSDLPRGDWYQENRRCRQEILRHQLEMELLRSVIQKHL